MKIKFFAYFRDYTNVKEVEIEYSGILKGLLEELCVLYGRKFEKEIFVGHDLSDSVIILINGRNIAHLDGLNTPLNENDEICIFPVVAGG